MRNEKARRSRRRRAILPPNTSNTDMSNITTITLPSGRTATIELGKGKHVRQAQKMSEGDSNMYMNCMMSLLVTVDGVRLVPEDFDELQANDYVELLAKMSEVNFTSAPKN